MAPDDIRRLSAAGARRAGKCKKTGTLEAFALFDEIDAVENNSRARNETAPLFTALGVHRQKYFFRNQRGLVVYFDSRQLTRCGAALEICTEYDHWAALYPSDNRGVDWVRIGATLIEAAQAAGDYRPPPGVGPAPVGRPRLS